MNHTIICGDTLTELKKMPNESVDCVITSPPYWALRDYGTAKWQGGKPECNHTINDSRKGKNANVGNTLSGQQGGISHINLSNICALCGAKKIDLQIGLEPTFQAYVNKLCDIFDEVKRVLKKEGTLWINLGDSYAGSGEAGGDYNEGGIKEGQPKFKQARGQTLPDKNLCNIPARFSIEMQNRGYILRNIIIWHKPNCMPSSVKDRFTTDYEFVFFFVKQKHYYFETQYEPHTEANQKDYEARQKRGMLRWGTGQKAKNYNGQGIPDYDKTDRSREEYHNPLGRNKRCVWTITTKPFREAHFATYPPELITPMIKAGSPQFVCLKCGKPRQKIMETDNPSKEFMEWDENRLSGAPNSFQTKQCIKSLHRNEGGVYSSAKFKGYTDCGCNAGFTGGTVLDIFAGAGTTNITAEKLGRNSIGIELNPKYVEIIKKRFAPHTQQHKLEGNNCTLNIQNGEEKQNGDEAK